MSFLADALFLLMGWVLGSCVTATLLICAAYKERTWVNTWARKLEAAIERAEAKVGFRRMYMAMVIASMLSPWASVVLLATIWQDDRDRDGRHGDRSRFVPAYLR